MAKGARLISFRRTSGPGRLNFIIVFFFVKSGNDKGAFKYYVITFLAFLGPHTHLFDDLQYCKSSKRWVGGCVGLKKPKT